MGLKFTRRAALAGMGAAAAAGATLDGALGAGLTAQHGFNDEGVEWRLFDEALEIAGRENKPIFMIAHAVWCPNCEAYKELFFDGEVVELLEGFVPVLVDTDLQPEINQRYGVFGEYVPRTMVLDPVGGLQVQIRNKDFPDQPFSVHHPKYLRMFLRDARRVFGLPKVG